LNLTSLSASRVAELVLKAGVPEGDGRMKVPDRHGFGARLSPDCTL
jgi:L-alanine-DL-glutamate epimerase-like enolase superfamily enzyme